MNKEEEEIIHIIKELNISKDRYVHIISYIQQLLKDYRENPVDIIREIPLNLKGNEKYFAIFVVGRFFSPLFYKMNDKEKAEFVIDIADALKFSDESIASITDYMIIIKNEMLTNVPTIDIIKKIIDSKFTDIEKNYLIFIYGLILE